MATLRNILDNPREALRRTADYYDELSPQAQFAINFVPGLNVLAGMGQMDKYASQGDTGAMGITAMGTLFPPLKAGKPVLSNILRHISPRGLMANTADTVIELTPDAEEEWKARRAMERQQSGW